MPEQTGVAIVTDPAPFWRTKRLDEMTREEWEALCDGCGRCCLFKTLPPARDSVGWTNVACKLLDIHSSRCSDYPNRMQRDVTCFKLTPASLAELSWMLPPSCAYRLVAEGKDLAWWHPLVSGDPETVHRAGVSVRGRAVHPHQVGPEWMHRVDWPARLPRGLRESRRRPAMQAMPPSADDASPAAAPLPGQAGSETPRSDDAGSQAGPPADKAGSGDARPGDGVGSRTASPVDKAGSD